MRRERQEPRSTTDATIGTTTTSATPSKPQRSVTAEEDGGGRAARSVLQMMATDAGRRKANHILVAVVGDIMVAFF